MTGSEPTQRVVVPGSERDAPHAAHRVGDCDANERIALTMLLRPRAGGAGTERLAAADEPYPERAAYARTNGADPADVVAVERFALAAGFVVLEASYARRSIVVEGSVSAVASAFGATVAMFADAEQTFRARTGPLTIPAALDGIVVGVFGIDERPQARAHFRPAAAPATSYAVPQIASAYAFPTGPTGAGQTIGLIELGGGYTPSDLSTYFANLGLALPAVTSVSVDGATNAPTGSANGADGEVELDIEVAGAVAPGAAIVVYFAPNTDRGFLDAVTTAVHDDVHKITVLSISWGGPESTWTAQATAGFDAAFADAAALGITVTVAAGDNGSTDGVAGGGNHVDFPASSPHVLACGGTTLHATDATIASETVWNDGASGGATGGGVSAVFALPAYQSGAGVPAGGAGNAGRGVPDVSGVADPDTGYRVVVDGAAAVFGGTSAVAPLWAGLVARLNERAGKPLGFMNATLYANPHALRDITAGTNGAFAAKPGWDACTGLGSPNGGALAELVPVAAS